MKNKLGTMILIVSMQIFIVGISNATEKKSVEISESQGKELDECAFTYYECVKDVLMMDVRCRCLIDFHNCRNNIEKPESCPGECK